MKQRERITAQYLLRQSGDRRDWAQLDPSIQEEYLVQARAIITQVDSHQTTTHAEAHATQAEALTALDDVALAKTLAQDAESATRTEVREVAARRAKMAQVDAYRARIAGTIPAHRLDTRMTGFLDGWDAALRYLKEQGK